MTINSQDQYEQLLDELWELWDSQPNSPEQARFIELRDIIEEYERREFPIPSIKPITTLTMIGYIVSCIIQLTGLLIAFVVLMLSIASVNIVAMFISGAALFVATYMTNKTAGYMRDDFNERSRR